MRSRSTCTNSSVSARRTRSPVVGPNISAYWRRVSLRGMASFPFGPGLRPGIERAVDLRLQAVDLAQAGQGDELHALGVARLEADGGAGGNVQPEAAGGGTVEAQGVVGLEEMVVRTDLDRAVAGVGDVERDGRQAGVAVEGGRVGRRDDFAGDHGFSGWGCAR